jgi:hypothetical protein
MAVEDQFAGVEITDNDVDRIEVVGDLISLIETLEATTRRRSSGAEATRAAFRSRGKTDQTARLRRSCFVFLRVAGDAMRNLIGWCPETRQPIDLKIYVDDATLAHIWSKGVRFQCPHCGVRHETKVERLASRSLSLEPHQGKRKRYHQGAVDREQLR